MTLELTIGLIIKKGRISSPKHSLMFQYAPRISKAIPLSLYQKVQFPREGAIVTIYGDTLTVLKPIFGIDFEKEPLTLDDFEIKKPSFERREKEVEKIPMGFTPYSNNNVVAMMRRMDYLLGMNLGKTVKKATAQVPIIPTATPPFGLGYKSIDDDFLKNGGEKNDSCQG